MAGWQRVHLDELPELPGPDTLTWRPARMHLGVRAFGTNAYTATEAGVDVVEPHTEQGAGHEELYFVHRGSARFTLDGETFDAPAGTYVHVADPAVHRHAVALEAGTTVLSFGGPPTFEPSAWEWTFLAAAQDDLAQARKILAEGQAARPEHGGLAWHRARLEARAGDAEQARRWLAEALRLDPALEAATRDEPALAGLL